MRRVCFPIVGLTAVLGVAGCAAGPEAGPPIPVAGPAPAVSLRGGDLALAALVVPRPTAVRPVQPVRISQTAELIGLDSSMLEQRLGTPTMLRRDAPAEVWQYRSSACVLSVFLYVEGSLWRVTYVDIGAPRGAAPVSPAVCLASLSS